MEITPTVAKNKSPGSYTRYEYKINISSSDGAIYMIYTNIKLIYTSRDALSITLGNKPFVKSVLDKFVEDLDDGNDCTLEYYRYDFISIHHDLIYNKNEKTLCIKSSTDTESTLVITLPINDKNRKQLAAEIGNISSFIMDKFAFAF